jgi:hypothetical protein
VEAAVVFFLFFVSARTNKMHHHRSVGVWGVWVGPGLVWMGCDIFAAASLWGGRLLEAGHQSSSEVCRCW